MSQKIMKRSGAEDTAATGRMLCRIVEYYESYKILFSILFIRFHVKINYSIYCIDFQILKTG